MDVFHFSEDSSIQRFEPHVPATNPEQPASVWAIDAEHAPLYWFPRHCPRVATWPRNAQERVRFQEAFHTTADRIHAVELRWLPDIAAATLFRYRFDATAFRPWPEASGQWISDLLPWHGKIADDICIVRSMYTEAINHDPAITYIQTGSQIPGRPSLGAWLSYGLGRVNENLPGYVVMHARSKFPEQSLFGRLWGTGFMPSEHQGVLLRSEGDAVLYLKNPAGVSSKDRRAQLDTLAALNQQQYQEFADPEILARIKQHELAYRMQSSVPELMDLSGESDATFELYGEEARQAGSFAACCLNARRLAERGVRNIQIFHRGWDAHGGLPREHESQCKDIDQGCYALIKDLKQRGMLDETLVVWGGEFGRTSYCQGKLTKDNYGRDHHPRCFTTWMAGGGIKPGITYGQTDDYAYNIADADGNAIKPTKDKWTPGTMHIHDLNATILNQLGIDHRKLTYRYQGRDFRLTDVHGHVIRDLVT